MPEIDEAELEAELDALGDDIALDEDTSYLDEIAAPNAPTKEGADSVAVNAATAATTSGGDVTQIRTRKSPQEYIDLLRNRPNITLAPLTLVFR